MKNRIKAPLTAVAAALVLSGCNLLDVDNPNSLVEESIRLEAAANGVANGSLQLVSNAISDIWEGPSVVADELDWIGSRDAWGSLDQGAIDDPNNEFLDSAFPTLGRGVWMAQNAVEILAGHVAENPGVDSFEKDYARSLMFRGLILMVVAESQQDMTFSYKMTDGPAVSSGGAVIGSEGNEIPVASMDAVMDVAISSLVDAKTRFAALGEDDLELNATALLVRAESSEEIMGARNSVGGALDFADAIPYANELIAAASGSDWKFNLNYSSASSGCDLCGNISDRKENQFDQSLVTWDASNDVDGIALQDPISGGDDLALINAMDQFRGGSYLDAGTAFVPLTVTSARLAHVVVAEHELANGNGGPGGAFEAAINALRDIDDSDAGHDFTSGGAVSDVEALQHSRRVNTLLQGLRLQDMYRWGLEPGSDSAPDARWQPGATASTSPGTMLPITIIEIRANCNLNGQGCSG
ncbi:MAG: hypothetical protein OEN56_03540 [Gemmatimonadota bacterium]|nr:hypothetical protein [Gemmatimonadota bacterium]MDH3424794.1 hypothetical protein [Gemmatimonadota bacterium]